MENLYALIFVVGLIAFIIGVIIFADTKKLKDSIIMFAGLLLIAISLVISVNITHKNRKTYNTAISEGYQIFVDGMPVEAENIDIENYKQDHITINDDTHKILISTAE